METVQLVGNESAACTKAVEALRADSVILYPTDTLYGLGADAFSNVAVDKIYSIKGRDPQKPIHAICADMQMIEQYAEVTDIAHRLAEKFLPGALTLVLKKKEGVIGGIVRDMKTIGVRIPDNAFCIETARAFGKPFTATSANTSGVATGLSIETILGQLGMKKDMIRLIVDAGTLQKKEASTVVSLVNGYPEFLRVGAISREVIIDAL